MKFQGSDLASFPSQIEFAIDQFDQRLVTSYQSDIDQLIICGLGGSGIAGRIAKAFFSSSSKLPIHLVADYSIPATVTDKSLVICSSYSGNTEETLSCYHQAVLAKARIICITGGGELAKLSVENGHALLKSISGLQPRMALGYSLTYLMLIIGALTSVEVLSGIKSCIPKLKMPEWHQKMAKAFMNDLSLQNKKFLQIVADAPNQALAVRFQQQLNENSKIWAQVHDMPEMCHNVIEAITNDNLKGPWLLLSSNTNNRNSMRFDYLESVLHEKGYQHKRINVDSTLIEELFDHIFIFDWISLLIADFNGLDSSAIPNIKGLKAYLS